MSTDSPSLEFDDVVIDFAGRRLLRAGEVQPVEPKAFAVLALLVGSPGQALSRDDILDAVWGHRHVTPGVLNRIVTLLRQALGEDAHHPRLLHTLHGVGYRFDLPAPQPPVAEATPADRPEPVAEAAPADAFNRRATDRAPPRRPGRASPWLLPLLAALGLAGWWLWPRAEPTPTAPASSRVAARAATPTLVVMPLKPIGGGDGTRVVADGLGEELICSLSQIDGLRVIARDSTRLAAAESDDPAQLVQRLGITHALEGNLQQAGQSLRVRLRLVDARGSGVLWTKDFDRDASEVLTLQREIAQAVATSLTLKLGLAATPGKSGDAEFLRRYLAARALLLHEQPDVDRSVEQAESAFRALVRERPEDARTHAGLALALTFRAHRRPEIGAPLREEAAQEAAIAQRMDPSLPEPWFVQARGHCLAGRWDPCLDLLAKAQATGPGFEPARNSVAWTLAQLGYLDRAEMRAREDLARDPINSMTHFKLARYLDTEGRYTEALAHYARSDRYALYGRWFNAALRGDYAAAARIADGDFNDLGPHAPRLKPGYVATSRALLDPRYWPEAEIELRRFEQGSGLFSINRVLLPDAPAHAAELIAGLNRVRMGGYSSWDLLLWTRDLAFLRRDPAFQKYLRDNGILAYWRKHGFPKQCRPHGDGALCE